MSTPLWDNYLSNENFDKIKDFENFNMLLCRVDDHIEISFKHTYSPNVFIYEKDGLYYLCSNHKVLENKFPGEPLIRQRDFFKTLYLYRDHYEFDFRKHTQIYSITDKYKIIDVLKKWIVKYKKVIGDIDPNDLIIELSSGIDTRVLSYFWRYKPVKYKVYTKPNHVETEIALPIINYIKEHYPCDIELYFDKNQTTRKYSLNGGSILHNYFHETTKDDLKDIAYNSKECDKAKHLIKDICPFYDREYMRLLGRFTGEIKLTLNYLMNSDTDLYKLPAMQCNKNVYVLDENITKFCTLDRHYTKAQLKI